MADRLTAIRATHDDEANMRVGHHVRDKRPIPRFSVCSVPTMASSGSPVVAKVFAKVSSLRVQTATGAWYRRAVYAPGTAANLGAVRQHR